MKVYLVTHGASGRGYDPLMTQEGIMQIVDVREDRLSKIPKPPLVVVGTGIRFRQMNDIFGYGRLKDTPAKLSPFCGTADGPEQDGLISVAGGRVLPDDYIGLIRNPGFDAWKFVSSLRENTLLCSGEELMLALGLKSDEGELYELDTETKSFRLII